MKLGQLLAFLPRPPLRIGRCGPWRRLDELRDAFDRNVLKLIAEAEADPGLGERADVLAFLVRGMRDKADLSDELMTLVCAGHETTASTLAWTFERLRRHPNVLAELVREVDEGGCAFRRATIAEAQRVRPVIDVFGRRVASPYFDLGGWRIPRGRAVLVRIADVHDNPDAFDEPARFDPHRFRDGKPTAPAWLAFGGGARRCIGAGFATAEIGVVLRTVLRNFTIQTDAADDEKSQFRGIAHVPARGGVVVVNRRT